MEAWVQAGASLLHYAAQSANGNLIKVLIRNKADINAQDNVCAFFQFPNYVLAELEWVSIRLLDRYGTAYQFS